MSEVSPSATGLFKSAVLLASLGTEAAAKVLSHMDDRQVEAIVREMAQLGPIRTRERDMVLDEFGQRIQEYEGAPVAGMELARKMLEQAMGPERAGRILGEIGSNEPAPPSLSQIIETTSAVSLAALVSDEHPQLVALLIGQLPLDKAAALLAALPQDVQGQVALRVAEMETPGPNALQYLERCLVEKLRGGGPAAAGEVPGAGPRRVADILSNLRKPVESSVMASLEEQAPAVAQKIARFRITFEDVLALDGRAIQRVLRDIDTDTLRVAIKGADEESQEKVFSNMSERAAARLREELETSGPVRVREIEAAQQAIINAARALKDSGEIQFGSAETEEEEAVV